MHADPRGSLWHRWDPHLHAPGTLLSDQFQGDWDAYLSRIEAASPPIEALGVTDYFCIRTYQHVRKRRAAGALPGVVLLFPNVEMRLNIGTDRNKGINVHLLFSPEHPEHEAEIERLLSHLAFQFEERKYACTLTDLVRLGRAFDASLTDQSAALRAGANQFKADLSGVRELCQDTWFRRYGLVAIAGSEGDGTAGLQHDASMAATRREIERLADIIFSGTPQQRSYWLGLRPGHDRAVIEERYGSLKPCLQGSDAHRAEGVGSAPVDRYCWIKGDLTFETLRQAVLEPEDRVWLGQECPGDTRDAISALAWNDAPWLEGDGLPLNPGLVAVIGPRGSGKTAFVDFMAAASGALAGTLSQSSFLRRASYPLDLLGSARVDLHWQDDASHGTVLTEALLDIQEGDAPGATCYLSQHFVERLCSSDGLAVELRREMERVVFEATDPLERQEAEDFAHLVETLLTPIRHERQELVDWIDNLGALIDAESALLERLPQLRRQAGELRAESVKRGHTIESLLPKGADDRTRKLMELEARCGAVEKGIEALRRQRTQLDTLTSEVRSFLSSREPAFIADLKRRYLDSVLSVGDWENFHLRFAGDVNAVISGHRAALDRRLAIAEGRALAPGTTQPSADSLIRLRALRDEARKEAGVDAQKRKEYDRQRTALSQIESTLRTAEAGVLEAEGADRRRSEALAQRRAAYRRVIETIIEEEQILTRLYDPLRKRLQNAIGALSKIEFFVRREVDLGSSRK